MKMPLYHSDISPFMCDLFCHIPNTNLAFVIIAKNACSFIKQTAIYAGEKRWEKNIDKVHQTIGLSRPSSYLINFDDISKYEEAHGKLTKIAIWRNPIERFLSNYQYFCIEKEFRTYFHYLNLYNDNNISRFIDFAEFELGKSDPRQHDEHIRRQCDCYDPSQVDHIISIDNLNIFLREKGVRFKDKKTNSTSGKFIIIDVDHKKRIQKLYEDDFKIVLK